ncbi:GIY-YIG nuclease family protein [Pararhizobium qamdonense]|uniref:hypothetical protein n=1 Tax=Pararhizobium qamdonense TaxID=3031126 RepID=UPI0023E0D1B2|nr:hypothetical protein [Pararhizobium qamdonense]
MTQTANNSGIYALTVNGTTYIGASHNLKSRFYHHKRNLHLNRHHAPAIQEAFNTVATGNSAVSFSVLEYCNLEQLHAREDFHIKTNQHVCNSKAAGGGIRLITDDARENSRKRLTGRQMRYIGDFITPWGLFTSSMAAAKASEVAFSQFAVWKACKQSETVITRLAFAKSRYLQTLGQHVVGMSWAELGFAFVAKAEDDTGIKVIGEGPVTSKYDALSDSERADLIERLKLEMAEGLDEMKQSASKLKSLIEASKRHLH